ncbi:hypothetical protein ACIN8IBEIGE_90009 [Acinetobacter sp. 8I-beige]|nr:hypothetical protein ACIN8IBEIGE_90009 [Acinetobacter sp. 8I-beige]
MNQRPSGYEPDELPDCSIPHQRVSFIRPKHPQSKLYLQYKQLLHKQHTKY